jgi:hypothetical protein
MRKDAVFAVMLNVTLFRGMSCSIAQDPRYLRFSVLTPGGTTHYNLRVRFFLFTQQHSPSMLKRVFLDPYILGGKRAGRGGSPKGNQRQHPSYMSLHPIHLFLLHLWSSLSR